MWIPNLCNLFIKLLIESISLLVWHYDTLKVLRVASRLNRALGVSYQVMVKFQAAGLFLFLEDLSDFQEIIRDFRIRLVELETSFIGTWRFEGLKDDQELSDQLLTFWNKELFVEMDQEVFTISNNFKVYDFRLLVFVDPHRKNKCTLSMGLPPLFGLRIVKCESKNSFSELAHTVDP